MMADAITGRTAHPYDHLGLILTGTECLAAVVPTIVAVHADGTAVERLAP
jgi:hypothetical protein